MVLCSIHACMAPLTKWNCQTKLPVGTICAVACLCQHMHTISCALVAMRERKVITGNSLAPKCFFCRRVYTLHSSTCICLALHKSTEGSTWTSLVWRQAAHFGKWYFRLESLISRHENGCWATGQCFVFQTFLHNYSIKLVVFDQYHWKMRSNKLKKKNKLKKQFSRIWEHVPLWQYKKNGQKSTYFFEGGQDAGWAVRQGEIHVQIDKCSWPFVMFQTIHGLLISSDLQSQGCPWR